MCSISPLQPRGFSSESPPGTQGCCPGTSLCPPTTVPAPLGCSGLRVALPSTAECSPPSPTLPHHLQPSAGWERSKEGPCPPSPLGTLPHCRVPRGWAGSHRQLRCRPDPGHKSSPKVQQALEADLILISFSPLKIEPLIPTSKHSPALSPPPFSLSLSVPPPASHWGQQGSATSSVIICPLPCHFFSREMKLHREEEGDGADACGVPMQGWLCSAARLFPTNVTRGCCASPASARLA